MPYRHYEDIYMQDWQRKMIEAVIRTSLQLTAIAVKILLSTSRLPS